jgi:hypothetical protein
MRVVTLRFIGLESTHSAVCEYGLFADTTNESVAFCAKRDGFGHLWQLLENENVVLHPVFVQDGRLSEMKNDKGLFESPDMFWKSIINPEQATIAAVRNRPDHMSKEDGS